MDRLEPALERDAYIAEDTFVAERERLRATQWTAVGRCSDLESTGSWRRLDWHGDSIVLVRDGDDLHAFFNVCRHRGAELCPVTAPDSGSFAGGVIQCAYHAWTYALDGTLRRAPFLDELPALRLHELCCATWGGFVFVTSGNVASSLTTALGAVPERLRNYPLAELRRGARVEYDVAANWKVLAENYNECYHCGPVHPELCDIVPAFRHGGGNLDWERGIPHRDGAWTFTQSGTSLRAPFAGLDDDEKVRHKGELIYPNLWLSLSADHVATFTLWPRSAQRTRVVCEFLFDQTEIAKPGFDPSDAVEFWDRVNRQDWAVCESVQRGMQSSAYTHGWFAPMEDPSLDIRRWYEALLRDEP